MVARSVGTELQMSFSSDSIMITVINMTVVTNMIIVINMIVVITVIIVARIITYLCLCTLV